MLSNSSMFMANGLFDPDKSGVVVSKIDCNGLSNSFCAGATHHRGYFFSGIAVTSLKDCSFKDRDRRKFSLCQEKNDLRGVFLNTFLYMQIPNRTTLKINGKGGWVKTHNGRPLQKPSQIHKDIRQDVNKIINHTKKKLD